METLTRAYELEEVRVRRSAGGARTFEGTAIVYGRLSEPMADRRGPFRERIAPGAGQKALRSERDIRLLVDHNPLLLLGRTSSGTLDLEAGEAGIRARSPLPDTTYARDLEALLDRGDVRSMSFRFYRPRDSWEQENGERIRTLKDFGIREVSVVLSPPAYEDTTAGLTEAERTLERAAVALEELRSGEELRSDEGREAVRSLIRDLEGLLAAGEKGSPVELLRRRQELEERDARFRLGLR